MALPPCGAILGAREARDSMEEAEVRDVRGRSRSWARWALTAAALALAVPIGDAVLGGSALAQDPPPVYDIPTPTPTPTPRPTPTPTPAPSPTPGPATSSGPQRLSPFPTVRTAGYFTRDRTTFTRVTVRAPQGAQIVASCSRHRCRQLKRTLARTSQVRVTTLQRSFPAATTINIRVGAQGAIGKHVQIRTRKGRRPTRRDRCLMPGGTKPVSCEGL
jgi:hypothetical protein